MCKLGFFCASEHSPPSTRRHSRSLAPSDGSKEAALHKRCPLAKDGYIVVKLGAIPNKLLLVAGATLEDLIDAIVAGQDSKPKFNGNAINEHIRL